MNTHTEQKAVHVSALQHVSMSQNRWSLWITAGEHNEAELQIQQMITKHNTTRHPEVTVNQREHTVSTLLLFSCCCFHHSVFLILFHCWVSALAVVIHSHCKITEILKSNNRAQNSAKTAQSSETLFNCSVLKDEAGDFEYFSHQQMWKLKPATC